MNTHKAQGRPALATWQEVQEGELIATWTWDGRYWETAPDADRTGAKRTMAQMAECLIATGSCLLPAPLP